MNKSWLRDHCKCKNCIHPSNQQKLHSSCNVHTNPTITEMSSIGNQLKITWAPNSIQQRDEAHESVYDLDWIKNHFNTDIEHDPFISKGSSKAWDINSLPVKDIYLNYEEFMNDSKVWGDAINNLAKYGLCFIRGAPLKEDSVTQIGSKIGNIMNTFYGLSWNVKSEANAKNIAYTSLDLGLHMDLLYFESPPGIQLLHCLTNEAKGGDSLFVDGYKAIEYVKKHHPESFEILQSVPIPFHYLNDGRYYRYTRPTVKSNPNEHYDLFFAPPFQGPIVPPKDIPLSKLYTALNQFSAALHQPQNLYQVKMSAGDCVLFANRRVLHGRTEFDPSTGDRWLKGAYVSWDDFKNKFRTLHYNN